jgi:hypothetical protein
MKASITYAALAAFLIMCACAVPALAFQGPYTDAQRLGAVGVPAGLAVVLWALRDARATVARWRVEGELRRAEKERQERRERVIRMKALNEKIRHVERQISRCSEFDIYTMSDLCGTLRKLESRRGDLAGQIIADEAREEMEAQP